MAAESIGDAMNEIVETVNSISDYDIINFTPLGMHFMAACTAPCPQAT